LDSELLINETEASLHIFTNLQYSAQKQNKRLSLNHAIVFSQY